ncbi:hypothetical protein [Pontixanthobacter sp.]|uniref:hypothetical protein n=1 Tax=Pontixanthobacter sp. TaxID=2792078 RepID=UPI003C7A3E9B
MRTAVMTGILGCALASGAALHAQVSLSRAAYVERLSDNGETRSVVPATILRSGDTVILMVSWQADQSRNAFTVSSPIPKHLSFKASASDRQVVSIDGGKNWARLADLTVKDGTQTRRASAEDVTHLRWRIAANTAARGSGKITYSAIVR